MCARQVSSPATDMHQGCVKQSPGRLHGSLDVDDGKDVCARTWGFGTGVAADAALGDDTGEPVAFRDLRSVALGSGFGNRGFGDLCTYRHCEAVALGSRAQRLGLRMRWLARAAAL